VVVAVEPGAVYNINGHNTEMALKVEPVVELQVRERDMAIPWVIRREMRTIIS
jgi:hypothetical protein